MPTHNTCTLLAADIPSMRSETLSVVRACASHCVSSSHVSCSFSLISSSPIGTVVCLSSPNRKEGMHGLSVVEVCTLSSEET